MLSSLDVHLHSESSCNEQASRSAGRVPHLVTDLVIDVQISQAPSVLYLQVLLWGLVIMRRAVAQWSRGLHLAQERFYGQRFVTALLLKADLTIICYFLFIISEFILFVLFHLLGFFFEKRLIDIIAVVFGLIDRPLNNTLF